MQLGLYAPLPHVNYPEPLPDVGANVDPWYRLALETVQTADAAGFDITLIAQRYWGPDLDAWMLASALAQATERIRIMPAFHPGFWVPQVLAKMGATLDRISGGRLAMNLVTGWWVQEHQKFGGEMLEGEDRYARSEEMVHIVRRLWAEDSVTYHSPHYHLDDVQLQIKPVQANPPIYGAARSSERGLEMIARTCDWWFAPYDNDFRNFDANITALRATAAAMAERASRLGRQVHIAVNATMLHDEDEAAALRLAEAIERHGEGGGVNRIHAGGLGVGLIGGRARILERLAQLEDAGVEMVLLKWSPELPGLRDFIADIVPAWREARVTA